MFTLIAMYSLDIFPSLSQNALNARLESLSQDLQESKKNNTSLKDQVEQLQRDLHQAKKVSNNGGIVMCT